MRQFFHERQIKLLSSFLDVIYFKFSFYFKIFTLKKLYINEKIFNKVFLEICAFVNLTLSHS